MHPDAELIGKVFVGFTIICIFLVYAGLKKLADHSNDTGIKRTPNTFLSIVVLWIGVLYVMSLFGITSDFSVMPPRMFILLLFAFILISTLVFSGRTDKMLILIPHGWLVNIQSFRVGVELILWWMSIRYLIPAQMTFEGLNFDILAGLSAPFIYLIIRRVHESVHTIIVIWNVISLLLLVNIVSIAILSLPTGFRVFMNEPSAFILSKFPFILLPGILVPLAYSMHFLSLRKIFIERYR